FLRLLGLLAGPRLLGCPGLFGPLLRSDLSLVRRLDVDVFVGIHHLLPRPLAGRTLRPRRRLGHHGRPTTPGAAVVSLAAVACGVVGSVALVAHRMLLCSLAIPLPVPC